MRIQNFILGLMFFIVSSLIVLSLVFDVYSPQGYDIDLSNDTHTATLADLQTNAQQAQTDSQTATDSIWEKTPGQSGAEIESGDVTEGDMIKSSIRALTNIGDYLDVFTTMMSASFVSMGLGVGGPLFWFFTSSIILIVGLLLISSVLRNYI
jgi:hypothetical protein